MQEIKEYPYTVIDVANCIIKKFQEEGKTLSNMKLQKLVYYAYALNLHVNNRPLFKNNFRPWQYGPVDPELYDAVRRSENNPFNITKPLSQDTKCDEPLAKAVAQTVYNFFNGWSAKQLSDLTHESFAAWTATIKREDGTLNDDDIKKEIDHILEHGLQDIKR